MSDGGAGAPGGERERFVPGRDGPLPAYEHAHRYALAAAALSGLRVLDLASGCGYGSRILRSAGAEVVGLDLSAEAAAASPVPAVRSRAEQLPFADGSFEAVVCFEAIEHVPEPRRVVAEIVRVLSTAGVALLSTPDRTVYSERAGQRNPHHLAEMTRAEFASLLADHFEHVGLYGQSVWAGSWLAPLDADGAPPKRGDRKLRVLRDPLAGGSAERAPWADPGEGWLPTPLYVVAACARDERGARRLRRLLSAESVLHDPAQGMIGHYLEALEGLVRRDRQIEAFAAHARDLARLLDEGHERVAQLETHAHNLDALLAERAQQAEAHRTHAVNLEGSLRERQQRVAGLEAHTANLEQQAAGLEAHAANLERLWAEQQQQLSGLKAHVANLEQLLHERAERVDALETHAANLEQLRAEQEQGLRAHVANLEQLLHERAEQEQGLRAHAANLEQMLAQREAHLSELERHARELESSRSTLEQELEGIRATSWFRALRRLGWVR